MHEKASKRRASGLENLEQKRSQMALFESAKVSMSGEVRFAYAGKEFRVEFPAVFIPCFNVSCGVCVSG